MTAYNVINAASLTAGQPEDISVILANFQALASVMNGNLDNANLSPGAAIAASKLAGYPNDPLKALRGDGTWLGVGYSTSLPSTPVDGQEHILVDSLTAPTYQWRFRYNAGNSTAYKWEFIGGTPARILVDAQQSTTTANTWLDLATVGPTFTVPRSGIYQAMAGARTSHTAAGTTNWIAIYNMRTAAGNGNSVVVPAATNLYPYAPSTELPTCIAADELRVRYHMSNAGTANWLYRWLEVCPVRVS